MHSPHDDLAVIRRLMEESQAAVSENGKHFLVWGVIGSVGLLGTWLAVTGRLGVHPRWIWATLLGVGWGSSVWIGFRDGARARVRTGGRRLLSVLWVSCAIALSLLAAAGLFGGAVDPRALSGIVAVVVAIGFRGTAELTGLAWLRWVALAWWAGGALMLFVPGVYTLALLAAMALVLQVVPGAVLYARARRRTVETSA